MYNSYLGRIMEVYSKQLWLFTGSLRCFTLLEMKCFTVNFYFIQTTLCFVSLDKRESAVLLYAHISRKRQSQEAYWREGSVGKILTILSYLVMGFFSFSMCMFLEFVHQNSTVIPCDISTMYLTKDLDGHTAQSIIRFGKGRKQAMTYDCKLECFFGL